jgi:hypothetical protein
MTQCVCGSGRGCDRTVLISVAGLTGGGAIVAGGDRGPMRMMDKCHVVEGHSAA